MSESELSNRVLEALGETGIEVGAIEALASQLLWRIGRLTDDGPVTVRVGLASSVALFADLPRLKTASDSEIEAALAEGDLRVEWVGHGGV